MSNVAERPGSPTFRLSIGIATRGRAETLAALLPEISKQTVQPDRIIICGTEPADWAGIGQDPQIELVIGTPGLPNQRNTILAMLRDSDIVLFLDDDFLMAPHYIEATLAAMRDDPNIVVTTGALIADDARGPGLSVAQAFAMVQDRAHPNLIPGWDRAAHGYGCNMALRLAPIFAHDLSFDERLPLYGWSEDIDFTHRLGRYGEIAKIRGAQGIHLGIKSGRTPGRRLGYSQVANPIYLFGKGSYSFGRAFRSVGRNFVANAMRAIQPEPFIDRRGRLRGNAIALVDLLRGRLTPERMLDL